MAIEVANVGLANTFGHWLARTNELAEAMSLNCVTVGGTAAVGNAVVTGVFSVNTAAVDAITGYSGSNVQIQSTELVISNTASVTTIGDVNVKGQLNVDAVSTMKITGSNTTHQFLAAVDANGTMGFVRVEIPLDQLTDVDTTNVGSKDAETIIKWNANTSQWEANTLSLINSTRINTLNVGSVSSTLSVSGNVNVSNATMFVNTTNRRVGIGTLAPVSALSVNGSIWATGDISSFNTSDKFFKTNDVSIDKDKALDVVMSIDVKEFDWIAERVAESEYASPLNAGHDVGLIAQQLQKLDIPGLVMTRPDGTLAVNQSKLIPYLIAAVQKLNEH